MAALALVLPVSTSSAAGAAESGEEAVLCSGTQKSTYDPPLGPLPQDTAVHIKEDFDSCEGPVSSGNMEVTLHLPVSCATLIADPDGTAPPPQALKYHWSSVNGIKKSTITYDRGAVVQGNEQTIVIATGTVTDGFKKGSRATRTVFLTGDDLYAQCLEDGVEQLSGPTVLHIE